MIIQWLRLWPCASGGCALGGCAFGDALTRSALPKTSVLPKRTSPPRYVLVEARYVHVPERNSQE